MPKVPNNVVPPKDMPIVLPKKFRHLRTSRSRHLITSLYHLRILLNTPRLMNSWIKFNQWPLNLVKSTRSTPIPKAHTSTRCIPDKSLSGGSFPKSNDSWLSLGLEAIGSRKMEYSRLLTWLGGDVLPPKVEPVINFEGRDDYSDDDSLRWILRWTN